MGVVAPPTQPRVALWKLQSTQADLFCAMACLSWWHRRRSSVIDHPSGAKSDLGYKAPFSLQSRENQVRCSLQNDERLRGKDVGGVHDLGLHHLCAHPDCPTLGRVDRLCCSRNPAAERGKREVDRYGIPAVGNSHQRMHVASGPTGLAAAARLVSLGGLALPLQCKGGSPQSNPRFAMLRR